MKCKQLIFHDAARDEIRRRVDALAEAVKVTRLALLSAASIARLILTTGCMIAMASKQSADAGGLNPESNSPIF